MKDDTAAILAALDVAIETLSECAFDDDGDPPESSWARKCKMAHAIVSSLRSRIEKERPFLEAAMHSLDGLHALILAAQQGNKEKKAGLDLYLDGAMGHVNHLRELRTLVAEKPPEESLQMKQHKEEAARRLKKQAEKPPEEGVKS